MPDRPTGTVTFLFTDMEGSTRLWEEHPDEMRGVLARHDHLLRGLIEQNSGYVFTTAGDAFSAAFSDPRDALAAAIEAQLSAQAEVWAVGDVRVRMGIHSGIAHERDDDYFGRVVNRAARIMSAGHGGQTLVSQTTRDLLSGRLPGGVDLRALGEHRLRDLGAPEPLYQVIHRDLPGEFPALRTLDGHLNNLPVELTSFVGRREEIEETVERLRESRLLTLTGVGGSGKTRLAFQAAAESVQDFPDGVWVVELAALTDSDALAHWVAEEMDLTRGSGGMDGASDDQNALEVVVNHLRPRRALLILDNCEHVVSAAAVFALGVLKSCPNVKILATSREGLGVRGENLVQVPSLALTPLTGGLDSGYPDAVQLFAERAASVNSNFVLDDETSMAVFDICHRLDGMPLAIELAAARIRMLTAGQISDRLSDAFRLLTGGSRTALPRQQTLLATVEWSYEMLDATERMVFDRLAVFRGGFFLDAAEAIISGDGVDAVDVFDILASLVDKSMIQSGLASGRFGLLETLRQFALGKLGEGGQADEWRARHADYYAGAAAEAFLATRDRRQVEWFVRFEQDHDNLLAAITWALESGNVETAGRIVDGAWWFWQAHGHRPTATSYLKQLRDRLDSLPPALKVSVLTATALFDLDLGEWERGTEAGEAAVSLARELEDDRRLSLALLYRSNIVGHAGDAERAFDGYDEGYEVSRRIDDDWGMGWHMLNKGWIHRMLNEADQSEELLELSLRHLEKAEVPFGTGWALSGLGMARRARGDYEDATRLFREAISIQEEFGNWPAVAFNLMVMALSYDYADRAEEGLEYAERALTLHRERGLVQPSSLSLVGRLRRHSGDLAGTVDALEEALPGIADETEGRFAHTVVEYAALAAAAGRDDLAAPLLCYASSVMVRDPYEVPVIRAELDEIIARTKKASPGWAAVEAEWSHKSKGEVIPLIELTVRTLRQTLENETSGT